MKHDEFFGWTWHCCYRCDVKYDFEFRKIFSINFECNTCPKCHRLEPTYDHEHIFELDKILIVEEQEG
jgi:hypothetical protein